MIRSNSPIGLVAATTLKRDVHDNHALLLDLSAGFTTVLPKATGSGARYRFINKTASNAYVISAVAAGATFVGGYVQDDSGDTTVLGSSFMGATAGNNTYSATTAGGGGLAGDFIEFTDIYANVYHVFGAVGAVADPTNRFSTV
jgi:hypothetical protein